MFVDDNRIQTFTQPNTISLKMWLSAAWMDKSGNARNGWQIVVVIYQPALFWPLSMGLGAMPGPPQVNSMQLWKVRINTCLLQQINKTTMPAMILTSLRTW